MSDNRSIPPGAPSQAQTLPRRGFRILWKLLVLSAIPIGFLLLVGIVSYTNLAGQRTTIDIIVNQRFDALVRLSALSREVLTAHNDLARNVRWVALGYLSGDEAKVAILGQRTRIAELEASGIADLGYLSEDERRALTGQLGEYAEWLGQIGEIVDKDQGLAELYLGSADEVIVVLVEALAAVEAKYSAESQQYFLASVEGFSTAILSFFVILSVAVVLSVAAAYWIGRSIAIPLQALADKASSISSRHDLTQHISLRSNDEVGVLAAAFNRMIDSLRGYYDELLDQHARLEQARGELEALNRGLEDKVARRTAELERTNAQMKAEIAERTKAEIALRGAKQEAEAANQAKSSFLASMSHELRTPLNGILGYAQIMQRDRALDESHGNGIRIIRESGEHLLALINDILDMAKIEAGRLDLALADFSPREFCDDLAELFRMRAGEKGVGLVYRVMTDLPAVVRGDERRLRQVCFNLLGNAVKFTDQGEIRLEVGYDQGHLHLSVSDQGLGIAADKLDEIFLPFQQTGAQSYRVKGSGLGLAISKRLIEAMGGQIRVDSQLGQGSCFAFDVALPEAEGRVLQVHDRSRVVIGFEGGDYRVLVVDDRPQNRALLVDLLRPLGFQVEQAVDGQEALAMVGALRPQLILLDLLMPTMDGFTFAKRLRALPEHQDTVVIAVSASVLDGQSAEAIAAGCNAFLPKPIHADTLFAEIGKWLGLKWRYAQEPGYQLAHDPVASEQSGPINGPGPEQTAELRALAAQGDVQGVLDYIDEALADAAALGPFVRHVRMLAGGFRERELMSFLESFSSDETVMINVPVDSGQR
jgi:signal transduction histidine kinase/CheY-like chemotaxis protein